MSQSPVGNLKIYRDTGHETALGMFMRMPGMLVSRRAIACAIHCVGANPPAALLVPCLRSTQSPSTQALRSLLHVSARALASSSASAMDSLQPAAVFKYFLELTQIPRPSKQEHRVIEWLKAFAKEHNLSWKQDNFGNLVIFRNGSGGGENAPAVIVQGHLDMVCEKNGDVVHNFSTDPIQTVVENGWLKARGTTLGADNGVGVAAAMALLAQPSTAKLPPLQALFTLEEEIGLNGATALDGSMLTGKTLVNLDSEDWPIIYIGCAGAGDTNATLDVSLSSTVVPQGASLYKLSLTGLQGGHSGLQIDQGLANAVQQLGLTLLKLLSPPSGAARGVALVEVSGGDKRNAIAREASALLLLTPAAAAAAKQAVDTQLRNLQLEFGGLEPGLQLELLPLSVAAAAVAMEPADAMKLVNLMCILPHGPIRMSAAVRGLVETSTNFAALKPSVTPPPTSPTQVTYTYINSTRSSLPTALEAARSRIVAAAAAVGAKAQLNPAYSGWAPNPDSPVLELTKKAVASVIGREPKVTAIHAGLECGILGERLPGTDMVSFGPTILGAHSPDERLEVETVAPFWTALLRLMSELADRREA